MDQMSPINRQNLGNGSTTSPNQYTLNHNLNNARHSSNLNSSPVNQRSNSNLPWILLSGEEVIIGKDSKF